MRVPREAAAERRGTLIRINTLTRTIMHTHTPILTKRPPP